MGVGFSVTSCGSREYATQLFSGENQSSSAPSRNGLISWENEGNASYFFNNNVMQTGWQTISGNRHYFNPASGMMLTGWQTIGSDRYYFHPTSGIVQTGWITIDEKRFYLDPTSGIMQTGLQLIGSDRYYFYPANTWVRVDTIWIQRTMGEMATGSVRIDIDDGNEIMQVNCVFDSDGVMISPTTPSAITTLAPSPGDGRVTLNWSPPVNGGIRITGYEVQLNDGDWENTSSNTSHTFTGLTNGVLYTFRVRALNFIGTGAAASISATPQDKQWQQPLANNRFNDVPNGNWQNDPVSWADRNGITTGSPAGSSTFRPDGNVTRAEFVTFLHRVYGSPSATRATFSDMPTSTDFANAISWASVNGVTTGTGNNTFSPNANITREQIAAMLYRYVGGGVPAPADRLGSYTDQGRISTWAGARDAVNWAVYHGIMGRNTTTLNPGGNATRAEAVAMLHRVVETFDIPAP